MDVLGGFSGNWIRDVNLSGIKKENIKDSDIDYEYVSLNVKDDDFLSSAERIILSDVLYYDNFNGTDPKYDTTNAKRETNLAVQLQHVSDDDIKSYINFELGLTNTTRTDDDYDTAYTKIKDVFASARFASKTHVGGSGILSITSVQDLFAVLFGSEDGSDDKSVDEDEEDMRNAFKSGIQAAVSNFDKADNPNDKTLVSQDLNDFSTFYALTEEQMKQLRALYSIDPKSPYRATPIKFV